MSFNEWKNQQQVNASEEFLQRLDHIQNQFLQQVRSIVEHDCQNPLHVHCQLCGDPIPKRFPANRS